MTALAALLVAIGDILVTAHVALLGAFGLWVTLGIEIASPLALLGAVEAVRARRR